MATQLTPSQQAFVDSMTNKVAELMSTQLPGTFQLVSYPPGFHPAVQFGANPPYYNSTMLDAFNGTLEVGSNGMLTLGNAQFSTLYSRILENASYQYSTADHKVVNDPNIANQQISVVNTATSSGFAATYSVSPITYAGIIKALLENFSTKPTDWSTANISGAAANLPNAGYADLGQAIASAVQLLSPLNTILGAQTRANAELTAAKIGAQSPSKSNGGLQTGPSAYYVGWTPLPSNNDIQGGLQGDSKVAVAISARNFNSTDASFSIDGQAGFNIPVFDVLDIGLSAGASYDWSKHTSSSSSLDVSMEYKGVTLVQIDPLPLAADDRTGWYDQSLLQSIISGSGNPDISGFKIDPSNQYAPARMFGKGKPFSRLKTLVVSQAPTITMVFSADQAQAVKQSFKEHASIDVKLFGLFKVGSLNQSYSIDTVNEDSSSGKVTVTMGPPKIVGTVPLNQQVCHVLGGVADFPPPAA